VFYEMLSLRSAVGALAAIAPVVGAIVVFVLPRIARVGWLL
jgi:hypothetical protein